MSQGGQLPRCMLVSFDAEDINELMYLDGNMKSVDRTKIMAKIVFYGAKGTKFEVTDLIKSIEVWQV